MPQSTARRYSPARLRWCASSSGCIPASSGRPRLHRRGDPGVQLAPPAAQQAVVGGLLDQRVLEVEGRLLPRRAARRRSRPDAASARASRITAGGAGDRAQHIEGELPPDRGAGLRQLPAAASRSRRAISESCSVAGVAIRASGFAELQMAVLRAELPRLEQRSWSAPRRTADCRRTAGRSAPGPPARGAALGHAGDDRPDRGRIEALDAEHLDPGILGRAIRASGRAVARTSIGRASMPSSRPATNSSVVGSPHCRSSTQSRSAAPCAMPTSTPPSPRRRHGVGAGDFRPAARRAPRRGSSASPRRAREAQGRRRAVRRAPHQACGTASRGCCRSGCQPSAGAAPAPAATRCWRTAAGRTASWSGRAPWRPRR